jgi:hypothetical protein
MRLAARTKLLGPPDWTSLGAADENWSNARKAAVGGPRVLIATSVGLHMPSAIVETALAVGLTWRGAEVDAFLCDGSLPACFACQWDWFPGGATLDRLGPQTHLCPTCIPAGRRPYDELGLPVHTIGGLLADGEAIEVTREMESLDAVALDALFDDGLALGEHARAGALRFFARGDLDEVPDALPVLRRYAAAAVLTARAVRRLVQTRAYDVVVLNHGVYVPQGVVVAAAHHERTRVVTWSPAYKAGTLIFSHDRTYHHALMDEPTDVWSSMTWSAAIDAELDAYLEARKTGLGDQISFSREASVFDATQVATRLGLDPSRATIGVLTNVVWDAQLHYPANVYPDMTTWLFETIEHLSERPDVQVVVRVHPAELTGNLRSRQLVADELAKRFPSLPDNVVVIGPESPISTYEAMALCDSVLIYGTKMGAELTARGIPVVVAGEAWIRNKDITIDPVDRDTYLKVLDALPLGSRLDDGTTQRARRYAYHFFFRRMIPVGELEARRGYPPYRLAIDRIENLGTASSAGFDLICRGILGAEPFVFPAELAAT